MSVLTDVFATPPAPGPPRRGQYAEADRADFNGADDARNRIGHAAERMSKPDVIGGSTIGVVGGPQIAGVPRRARRIAGVRVLRRQIGPARFGPGEPRLLPRFDEGIGFADGSTEESKHGFYRNKGRRGETRTQKRRGAKAWKRCESPGVLRDPRATQQVLKGRHFLTAES
jgi:hypothetical protein